MDAFFLIVEREDFQRCVSVDDSHFAVVDINEVFRILDDGCSIGTQKIFAFADTYDHRAALAGSDDFVMVALFDDGDGISPDDLFERLLNGFQQGAVFSGPNVFDQVDQHFRVGTAAERISVFDQSIFQYTEIFNDAVMDQCDIFRFRVVGMGIGIVRYAMRRPAGVCDADAATKIFAIQKMFQIVDLSFAFIDIKCAVAIHHGDTCAIVTAVFETVQPFEQNRAGISVPDISYNSTHIFIDSFRKLDKNNKNRRITKNRAGFMPALFFLKKDVMIITLLQNIGKTTEWFVLLCRIAPIRNFHSVNGWHLLQDRIQSTTI